MEISIFKILTIIIILFMLYLLVKAFDAANRGIKMKEELDGLKFQYGEIPEKEFDKKWNEITSKWGFNRNPKQS